MNIKPTNNKVNIYFVASPLQYLAACRIVEHFEFGARQILIYYKPSLATIVNDKDWDVAYYLPWPRFEPLPGVCGRHRRLLLNLKNVATLVGKCETLNIHSAVFDTEAINYFIRGLPKLGTSQTVRARILPDGLISTRRYPLSLTKCILQWTRKLRLLTSPLLNYYCFTGDRIGSDASFVDRIYILPGLPHQYNPNKVVQLPHLVSSLSETQNRGIGKSALVIDQQLVGSGLLSHDEAFKISNAINQFLKHQEIENIFYKSHPKDERQDLNQKNYHTLELTHPIETHMSQTHYDIIIGVRSSVLLIARQIYGPSTRVIALGWNLINFKSLEEQQDMERTFSSIGIEVLSNHITS